MKLNKTYFQIYSTDMYVIWADKTCLMNTEQELWESQCDHKRDKLQSKID